VRVLTWNLFHGRADPPAGRELLAEFAAALAGWEWDVALLQEVPPWWPAELARAAGAQQRTALTSRNGLLRLRRALARRWPDLIKSGGGGANAILVRGTGIAEHRRRRLRWWPERRVVHAVALETGTWVGNLHAQVHSEERAQADIALAAAALADWAGRHPFVLGGDLNVRVPGALEHAGGHGVDHVLVRGFTPGATRVLQRGVLSDHAPVLVEVREGTPQAPRQEET
jgi:endonuclease/exonuclease/phosphatase family metal-dependent hydrolase